MRSRTPDRLCAEAVDVALAVTREAAGEDAVGEHLGAVAEGDRVVTHLFACALPAYRGWQWATTLTRASRAKVVTIDETVLLPGPDAVLAPEWLPWSDRLRPGDMGPGDLLPTEADDLRLEPGWTGAPDTGDATQTAAERGAAGEAAEGAAGDGAGGVAAADGVSGGTEAAGGTGGPGVSGTADTGTGAAAADTAADGMAAEVIGVLPSVAAIGAVARQLGMGRPRVLSRYGLHSAADRWDEQFGAKTPMAQAAPANCVTCGFLMPIGGSLGQAFGVCANEFSPADGRLVSYGYGCGGHSEAAVMPRTPHPAPMVLDELHDTEPLPLRPDPHASVEDTDADDGDLGHG